MWNHLWTRLVSLYKRPQFICSSIPTLWEPSEQQRKKVTMKTFMVLCVATLCLLQITSAHPKGFRGRFGSSKDGQRNRGEGRRPSGRRGPQPCEIRSGDKMLEEQPCREGTCDGLSLTVRIANEEREIIFCNRTIDSSEESSEEDTVTVGDRLKLAEETMKEHLVKSLIRSACKVNEEVKKPCENCTLGPVEFSDDGNTTTAYYCDRELVNEAEWLKIFKSGCKRPQSSESDEDDEEVDQRRFGRFRSRSRWARSPRRGNGPCLILNDKNETVEERNCRGTCDVGPVEGIINGESIKVFFCKRMDDSDSESSEEEKKPIGSHLARKMLCNACQIMNGTETIENTTCGRDDMVCLDKTFQFIDESGSSIAAIFCSPINTEMQFRWIDAFQPSRRCKSENSSEESDEDNRRPARRRGSNGGRRRGGMSPESEDDEESEAENERQQRRERINF